MILSNEESNDEFINMEKPIRYSIQDFIPPHEGREYIKQISINMEVPDDHFQCFQIFYDIIKYDIYCNGLKYEIMKTPDVKDSYNDYMYYHKPDLIIEILDKLCFKFNGDDDDITDDVYDTCYRKMYHNLLFKKCVI